MKEHIPSVAFCLFLLRLTYFGATIGDALALAALATLYGFKLYNDSKKDGSATAQLVKEVEQIKGTVNSLKLNTTIRR